MVTPAARPQLSWKLREEAFDNYLHLIYGCDLLVGVGPVPGPTMTPPPSDTSFLFFPVLGHKICKGIPAVGCCGPHHRVPGHGHPDQSRHQWCAGYL